MQTNPLFTWFITSQTNNSLICWGSLFVVRSQQCELACFSSPKDIMSVGHRNIFKFGWDFKKSMHQTPKIFCHHVWHCSHQATLYHGLHISVLFCTWSKFYLILHLVCFPVEWFVFISITSNDPHCKGRWLIATVYWKTAHQSLYHVPNTFFWRLLFVMSDHE